MYKPSGHRIAIRGISPAKYPEFFCSKNANKTERGRNVMATKRRRKVNILEKEDATQECITELEQAGAS